MSFRRINNCSWNAKKEINKQNYGVAVGTIGDVKRKLELDEKMNGLSSDS